MTLEIVKDTNHIPQLVRKLQDVSDPEIKVGVLDDAEGGTAEFTLAAVAAANEFGAKTKDGKERIPPRPFIRPAFDDDETQGKIAKALNRIFLRGETPERVVNAMGQLMTSAIRRKIRSGVKPLNAESTSKRKGTPRTKTLRHFGRLIRGIDYEII